MEPTMQKIAGEITLAKNPGASMKKWREIFGITQTELADYLKITPSTISDYESNRRKSPGIGVIRRFVQSLIEIDKKQGGWVIKRMEEEGKEKIFETYEFPEPVDTMSFIQKINGRIITNKRKLMSTKIDGYSLIDSLRAILELPVDEFQKIYGSSTNRALIFTQVGMGRSPMVAIRVTKLRPTLVVFHGLKDVDVIARKISEVEKIPIILTELEIPELEKTLKEFQTY